MGLLSDELGTIVMCHLNSASSAGSGSSNATGINIQGMSSILFLGIMQIAASSDGTTSTDGDIKFYLQYSSNPTAGSASGSDAATSNATMTCTDAVCTFTSANWGIGGFATLEINLDKKGFPDGAGYLFPAIGADSVSVMRVLAIPKPGTRSLPISQTTATTVADD